MSGRGRVNAGESESSLEERGARGGVCGTGRGMSDEVWSKHSRSLDLSEQEKEEVRVDLVPSLERWAGFGCNFLVHVE